MVKEEKAEITLGSLKLELASCSLSLSLSLYIYIYIYTGIGRLFISEGWSNQDSIPNGETTWQQSPGATTPVQMDQEFSLAYTCSGPNCGVLDGYTRTTCTIHGGGPELHKWWNMSWPIQLHIELQS